MLTLSFFFAVYAIIGRSGNLPCGENAGNYVQYLTASSCFLSVIVISCHVALVCNF